MSEVKEFLRMCRKELGEIKILRDQIEQLHALMLPPGIRFDDVNVQTSGAGDRTAEMISAAVDLEKKYNQRLAELIDHQNRAAEIITGVGDATCRKLLTLYYLFGLTFEETAEQMDYSTEYVIRTLHKRALEMAGRKWS